MSAFVSPFPISCFPNNQPTKRRRRRRQKRAFWERTHFALRASIYEVPFLEFLSPLYCLQTSSLSSRHVPIYTTPSYHWRGHPNCGPPNENDRDSRHRFLPSLKLKSWDIPPSPLIWKVCRQSGRKEGKIGEHVFGA